MSKKRYDIVFFPDALVRGGAERVTVRLSEYFISKGKKVAIVTTGKPKANDYDIPLGVDRISVGVENKNLLKLIVGYIKVLSTIEYGIGILMGLPHGCYIVPASILCRKKLVISERNSPANYNGKKITKILMTFFMKFGNGYIFQTEGARQYYKYKIAGKQAVISNPIDVDNIPILTERKNFKNLVSVGRLEKQKNHEMLIKAINKVVKNHTDVTLTIYGEGSLRDKLQKMITTMKLENNVFLPGVITNIHEKELNYGGFVFSSDFEGIPNALLEAMAIGLPCISTDCPCGGPSSVINNGENGILVPVGDYDKMANAIELLLDNPTLADELGNKAKQIRSILHIKKIGEEWLDFLDSI